MIKRLLLFSILILPLSAQQAAPPQNAEPPKQQSRSLQFTPVARESIETRLNQAGAGERAATLQAMFEQAGCKGGQLTSEDVKKFGPNVICVLKGETDSVILAGAHFDGKGVIDNWTGASLLPSLYESLSKAPRKHTYVFVEFTGKGKGVEGVEAYLKDLNDQQRSLIKAEVNVDALGLSPTKVWAEGSDKQLTGLLAAVAHALKSPILAANAPDDDSRVFAKEKIATVAVHSVTPETEKLLQTEKDNLAIVRMDDYYETYRLLCAYMAYLDGAVQ